MPLLTPNSICNVLISLIFLFCFLFCFVFFLKEDPKLFSQFEGWTECNCRIDFSLFFLFGQNIEKLHLGIQHVSIQTACVVNLPIKVCRKSTALLMCRSSPVCVIMFVIFDVNDGTFPPEPLHTPDWRKSVSWVLRS